MSTAGKIWYRVRRDNELGWGGWMELGRGIHMFNARYEYEFTSVTPVKTGYYRKPGCPTGDITWSSEGYPPPYGWEYLGDKWPGV